MLQTCGEGGGVTHLKALLGNVDPRAHGFRKVILWGGASLFNQIEDYPWLQKVHDSMLEGSLPKRLYWQRFHLEKFARDAGCDVLLVPGGMYSGRFHPFVTMCRNMLPFEWRELRRYGFSWMTSRLLLLRLSQAKSFERADGVIFLTGYAKKRVDQVVRGASGSVTVIPHGIDSRFFLPLRPQDPISDYSSDRPFRILYVSIVDVYKHQWNVVNAVADLRHRGLPVTLDLVGPAYGPALRRMRRAINQVDDSGEFIRYLGCVPHENLHQNYQSADLNVFASSCENLPNILLEGMASGLPVACSNRGPMPEVLGEAGVYFNPENSQDIARAIRELINAPELRAEKAKAAQECAKMYSWKCCAEDTFQFMAEVSSGVRQSIAQIILKWIRSVFSQRRRNAKLDLISVLACPRCHADKLTMTDDQIVCGGCGESYRVRNGIPIMHSPSDEN